VSPHSFDVTDNASLEAGHAHSDPVATGRGTASKGAHLSWLETVLSDLHVGRDLTITGHFPETTHYFSNFETGLGARSNTRSF
jgi:hypothetical protein